MAKRRQIMLGEIAHGRDNNFNLIRMIAASCVLLSHSYTAALGLVAVSLYPFAHLLGTTAVIVFFNLSGFLIAKSFDQSKSLSRFLTARALRLLPAVAVSVLATAYLLGPLVTSLHPLYYITRPWTARFVLVNLTFLTEPQYYLPGVFHTNPHPDVPNGSLWTLRYEIYCYGMAMACGLAGLYRRKTFLLFLLLYLAVYLPLRLRQGTVLPDPSDMIYLSAPFVIGMTLYAYRSVISLNGFLACILIACAIAMRGVPGYYEVFCCACAYTAFTLGYRKIPLLLTYNRAGDYSYGTYIYAFPVQQTLVHFLMPIGPVPLTVLAFPITVGLAVLSWHFIEQPALRYKHRAANAKRWGANPGEAPQQSGAKQ